MRTLKIVAAVVTAAALLVLPGTVQAGKLGGGLMEADPNSGFPGDSFDVRNLPDNGCSGNRVEVTVDGPAPFGDVSGSAEFFKFNWEVTLTVPEGSSPGPYLINATCETFQKTENPYVPVTYTVMGESQPSPSPDPSPSPSDDGDVDAERDEAPPAQPEVEAAAFTG